MKNALDQDCRLADWQITPIIRPYSTETAVNVAAIGNENG